MFGNATPHPTHTRLNSFNLPQTQERRAGEAHVSAAGEQAGADGAAGGSHEAVEGKVIQHSPAQGPAGVTALKQSSALIS